MSEDLLDTSKSMQSALTSILDSATQIRKILKGFFAC